MNITSTKGTATVDTIEAAAAWLVEMQPAYASVDGIDLEHDAAEWTEENATAAIEAAMVEHDREYRIALVMADGEWEVIDTFQAADDDAANAYAEEHHGDSDWYVLDANGRNINGGDQE